MIEFLVGAVAVLGVIWFILGVAEILRQLKEEWYPFKRAGKFQWFLIAGGALGTLILFGFISYWIGHVFIHGYAGDVR